MLQEIMENIQDHIFMGFSLTFHGLIIVSCNFIKVDQLHKG